jgi:threonine dehydratase
LPANTFCAAGSGAPYSGVVAFSSGNHAQGVAYACQQMHIPCTIVMPIDAPKLKIANTREYGATVVFYDRVRDDREAIAKRISEEQRLLVIPPYNSYDVMAGQGTCGLELCQQLSERGTTRVDMVLVPASGGGLIGGVSTAVLEWCPNAEIIVCEPTGHNDHALSILAGARVANAADAPPSICDSLLAAEPGAITFAVNRRTVARGVAVTDAEVERAMLELASAAHLVVEPGGAGMFWTVIIIITIIPFAF